MKPFFFFGFFFSIRTRHAAVATRGRKKTLFAPAENNSNRTKKRHILPLPRRASFQVQCVNEVYACARAKEKRAREVVLREYTEEKGGRKKPLFSSLSLPRYPLSALSREERGLVRALLSVQNKLKRETSSFSSSNLTHKKTLQAGSSTLAARRKRLLLPEKPRPRRRPLRSPINLATAVVVAAAAAAEPSSARSRPRRPRRRRQSRAAAAAAGAGAGAEMREPAAARQRSRPLPLPLLPLRRRPETGPWSRTRPLPRTRRRGRGEREGAERERAWRERGRGEREGVERESVERESVEREREREGERERERESFRKERVFVLGEKERERASGRENEVKSVEEGEDRRSQFPFLSLSLQL